MYRLETEYIPDGSIITRKQMIEDLDVKVKL
jgi:hypothetical protein